MHRSGPGRDVEVQFVRGLNPAIGPLPTTLILGTFPSAASRHEGAYYANPRNQFWWIIESILDISRVIPYRERVRALTARGIALWDTVAACLQEGSMDRTIQNPELNDIPGFLRANSTISLVAVNGRTAERFLKKVVRNSPLPAGIRVVVLPSTSPANARMHLDEKIRCWSVIRDLDHAHLSR